jgi:hypothetical protein
MEEEKLPAKRRWRERSFGSRRCWIPYVAMSSVYAITRPQFFVFLCYPLSPFYLTSTNARALQRDIKKYALSSDVLPLPPPHAASAMNPYHNFQRLILNFKPPNN